MLEVEQILQKRYGLKQRLGRNIGRQTWLAEDLAVDPPLLVVLKLLTFGGDVQWEDLKLFEREAQILKQLDHPRIPKYRDYFAIDDRSLWFGMVQEYIPGSSLRVLLEQKQRFTERQIRQIATEVLEILAYLHGLTPPVLHRDIKPSNLILSAEKKIYLVDFGAVQDRALAEGATLTIAGTYGYAPLEQFGGRAVAASDLYALGATLIHLLTGCSPAALPLNNLRLQFRDQVQIDLEFANWLEKMVEPALENRFQTVKQAQEGLQYSFRKTSLSAIAVPFTKLFQPSYSRIRIINKSPSNLVIDIPKQGIHKFSDILKTGILGLSTLGAILLLPGVFSIVGTIPLIFLLWLSFYIAENLFGSTQICFNRQTYKIKHLVFNFIFRQQQGFSDRIQDISLKYEGGNNSRRRVAATEVIITSHSIINPEQFDRSFLGNRLTERELMWLAQEIRDWLATSR
ncbi:MAG: serine/threonine protein kinase [Chloroflexaceae bacterium]|nr:serine/threonine protein kinase [Chloroflexaceae bacterium]